MKILLVFLLIPVFSFTQGFGDYISENAKQINDDYKLDSTFYEHFKKYNLIMVGEFHGTQEPATLVKAISELLLQNEETVSVGLEIPESQMTFFTQIPNDSILSLTDFFIQENTDGRNGKAWYDLISYCNSTPTINLFFFDNYGSMGITNRDSSMYLSIIDQMNKYPESKLITLSGSIHSWLIPFNNNPTMGNYCINDSLNFSSNAICSINHVFSEGTMLNSIGNGLELRTIEFEESLYSKSVDYKNYLVFYETADPSEHNCIYYTRKVNHSPKMEQITLPMR
ncbi:MAG: hypothetical protein HRT58_03395 [Crocinitomicaceae bacterium]|nr:hypothetical protein [Flavobacteriales bacterium]NQZ34677.1 hypothetical protein [Crocinitomicaceae bacterium]